YDHRLDFRMVDVRRNDCPASRDFVADKVRRNHLRDRRAEVLPRMLARDKIGKTIAALVFPDRDEFHLRSNDSFPRVMHLGDAPTSPRPARLSLQVEAQLGELRIRQALAP